MAVIDVIDEADWGNFAKDYDRVSSIGFFEIPEPQGSFRARIGRPIGRVCRLVRVDPAPEGGR